MRDQGCNQIACSRQLIPGRTGQEYNQRKRRNGVFWEHRYHTTAVENGEHLGRCLVYIDLDMVRAGVVSHPAQWASAGYHQLQSPPARSCIIERAAPGEALGVPLCASSATHAQRVDTTLRHGRVQRACQWTTSLAVGSREFVERIETKLRHRVTDREVQPFGATFLLHNRARTATVTFFRPKTSL